MDVQRNETTETPETSEASNNATTTGTDELDKNELTCFIHSVSPKKQSAHNRTNFFNCQLQTATKVVNAVCFSPEKQTTFSQFEQSKSPVKITKFTVKRKFDDENVIMNRYTQIAPTASVSFSRVAPPNPDDCVTIATLNQVASDQLVTFKGHVCHLSGIEKVLLNNGVTLMKQRAIVADPTASIEVILWQDTTEPMEEAKSYIFSNFRVKGSMGQQRYVNNPKTGKYSIKVTENFTKPIVNVENLASLTTVEADASIIGVNSITKWKTCCTCQRKVVPRNDKLGTCEGCKMVQKLCNCSNSWFLKLVVKDDSKSFHLAVTNSQVKKIVSLQPTANLDLTTVTEDELVLTILELDMVHITYDSVKMALIDIVKL